MRIGVDTGGTHTDIVLVTEDGVRLHKLLSTPDEPSRAVLTGVEALDYPLEKLLIFAHGSTIATNAVIQRRGAPTGLLTTQGFRDVLQIRRTTRGKLYDFQWDPPQELVPRQWRREVVERTNAMGEVTTTPDIEGALAQVKYLLDEGVQSLAICFINAYLNGENERKCREAIQKAYPDLPVYISSEILPEWREFERTSTTVVSSYIGPVLSSYLKLIEESLHEQGYQYDLMVMLSNGGLATAQAATETPAATLESGPAAGVLAQAALGELTGLKHIIGMDIGGTSTDISIIHDGTAFLKNEFEIEFGTVVAYPMIDINSIGAGGGTIAWVDNGGLLHSGPQSAGSQPGPVCLQRGGTEPTVTDANVMLRRLNPNYLLGGDIAISEEAAHQAIEALGQKINLEPDRMAHGILSLTVSNIAFAIRQLTVERGLDPREFALVAYGGAGPLLAAEVAVELGVTTVLIPPLPGLTSAFGLLLTDIHHDLVTTFLKRSDETDPEEVAAAFEKLIEKGRTNLEAEGMLPEQMVFHLSADLRYVGQTHEITVPLPGQSYDQATHQRLSSLLHDLHLQQYGHAPEGDQVVELVNLRAAALGLMDRPQFPEIEAAQDGEAPTPQGERQVFFDGWVGTPIYQRADLKAGMEFSGPAIVEQMDSTTVIPANWQVQVDKIGSMIMTLR